MYAYFLSENDTRNITLAASDTGRGKYDLPCPEGLTILLHAMARVSQEVAVTLGNQANSTTEKLAGYGMETREIVSTIDRLFQDPLNARIPILEVIIIVVKQARGATSQEIEDEIAARRRVINNHQ